MVPWPRASHSYASKFPRSPGFCRKPVVFLYDRR
jgi:hypothetical protein